MRALGRQAQLRLSAQWLWLIGLLLFGGGLMYLCRPSLYAAWRRFEGWQAARRTARLKSADYAWQLARKQLAQDPPELGGLYLWVRRRTGYYTLSDFSQGLPPSSGIRLLDWLQIRYGKPSGTAHVTPPLGPTLSQARRVLAAEHVRSSQRNGLKPLNP